MKKHALFASFILAFVAASAALAGSVTVLCADGSTWRGSTDDHVTVQYNAGGVKVDVSGVLTQAADLYIVVKKDDGTGEVPIFRSDIVDIKKADGGSKPAAAPKPSAAPAEKPAGNRGAAKPADDADTQAPAADGKGVFYLPLKEMVGLEFRPEEIQAIVAQADEAGPGQLIVLDIESGGGSVWEFIVLAEVIKEAKQRHQFVAWVGHSISAAAGTALCCDRLIWKSHGALGAITMHSGGRPVPDETEERWITMLKALLRESGHSEYWARPMVRNDSWISYTKDPVTGECEFFGSPQGTSDEIVLSELGENIVLNKDAALDCCLAEAVADNKEQLAKALDLPAWKELGTGQQLHDDWMRAVEQCKEYMRRSNAELGRLGEYEPMIALRKRIDIYKRWITWWKRAPNQMRMLGVPPVEQLEAMIEELKLELRRMAEGRRG